VLLSTEAAGMLSTGTSVLLAVISEGGAGSKAAGVLLAKGDATVSKTSDDRFDTAARFLDSRNLLVACRIGMSENHEDYSVWNVEIKRPKVLQIKISKEFTVPLLTPCPCLLQTYSNRPSVKN